MSDLDPRAEELLAERALRPLDDREHWELQQLGAEHDESFDMAAAAVMVATTVIEPMPKSIADKILSAAPGGGGIDWRRTLPGVAMPPPAEARDTMIGVDLSQIQEEAKATEPLVAQQDPTLPKQGPTILDTLPPPSGNRLPAIPAPNLAHTPHVDPNGTTLPPEDNEPAPQPRDLHERFAQVHTPAPLPAMSKPVTPLPPVIGRTPLPQDSQPYSVEQPPPSAPTVHPDELRARREAATVPLKPVTVKRSIAPWLAAAVCLLAAGGAIYYAYDQRQKPAVVAKSLVDQRAELVAAADVSKITWTVTQDPAAKGTTGDVVWSPSQQKGFMRFVGLAVNDPKQFQYQLWIFDKSRDQAFPVDGGVFDVTSTGEVIVAISPKLHVDDLALFAVTVEKPGGVVVSKREHIIVTATRSS